ncbi:MAG: hypothetical protein RBT34_00270 [Anaerolineaceae bacterium]|jgi:hypothetical protein|nr:hypothetical protein [Anaerolineaceae bacterium]
MPNPNDPLAVLEFMPTGMYRFKDYRKGKEQDKYVAAPDVAAAFTQTDHDSGWLPENIKRVGHCVNGEYYVLFIPKGKYKITLIHENEPKSLHIPLPSFVMVGVGNKHHLVATKENDFSLEAEAFLPPLPNVWETEGICWGNNTPPKAQADNAAATWQLFISSPFNNHLSEDKIKGYKSACDFLNALNGKQRFPFSKLLPTHGHKMTVDRWVSMAIKKT